MEQDNYIKNSLELHLFFDRIMKEHSIFLESAFMEKNQNLKRKASEFQELFSNILEEITILANNKINSELIESNEFVTKYTLDAENKTSILTGININKEITIKQLNINSGNIISNAQILNKISELNQRTLPVIANLIYFKEKILNKVLSCDLYTTNYPLLITHITNEAKMYYNLLAKIENHEPFTSEYIYEQELFWNNIMKEHAEFIRGLLDPSETELIDISNKFSEEYKDILEKYGNNKAILTSSSLSETLNFKEFKLAGEEGILNCKIKSIIIPLLADHIVREANHFIRILKNIN